MKTLTNDMLDKDKTAVSNAKAARVISKVAGDGPNPNAVDGGEKGFPKFDDVGGFGEALGYSGFDDSEYQPVMMPKTGHTPADDAPPVAIKLPKQKSPTSSMKRPSGVEVRPKGGSLGFAPAPVGLSPATRLTKHLKDSPSVYVDSNGPSPAPNAKKFSPGIPELEASPLDNPELDVKF